jgi:hypothetical protein
MIIETELAFLIAFEAIHLLRRRRKAAPAPPGEHAAERLAAAQPRPVQQQLEIEILKKQAGGWHSIGWRHAGHPDQHEALRTPDLAIRHADGRIEEGSF